MYTPGAGQGPLQGGLHPPLLVCLPDVWLDVPPPCCAPRIRPGVYVPLNVGDTLRFGQSSRLYILGGPAVSRGGHP